MQEVTIHDKTFEVLIAANDIQQRVAQIAADINENYAEKKPLFLGVLNGAFLFAADLFKNISVPCEISFIRVSSYQGTQSSGKVKSLIGLNMDINNRHIIVIEDIVDTGDTMQYLLAELAQKNPASVKLATMVFKPEALKHPLQPDFIGFTVPPDFLVGYGLDYDGLGRNLNDIFILKNNA
ncbi:MAG: hypoxanthine phosphoribosyltransferase [Bacteroidia bacterium]|nr:hypoxanthine phosphoribosyltransferase [Bacteroidia bacterium]